MATIDELTRLDRETADAELHALRNLGEHLRKAVLDMPGESKLARQFARHARALETCQSRFEFDKLVWGIRDGRRAEVGEAMLALADYMCPDDLLRPTVEQMARLVGGDE
jgi:hypothetical protein